VLSGKTEGCSVIIKRKPPTGTWGTAPLGIAGTQAWDVLPTQQQDNDPIRRACQGTSANNHARPGEEVCNTDGNLGLVLPMTDSDWIVNKSFNGGPALVQYPTNDCNAFAAAKAVQVLNCAPRGSQHHDGSCPNGDSEIGGACLAPVDTVHGRSDCVAGPSRTPTLHVRTLPLNYGRVYNLHMRDGAIPTGANKITYAQYPIPATGATVDFAGAYNRIHQVQTQVADGARGCQFLDMTDQLGCLAAADPCSIAFAGFEASNWEIRTNGYSDANSGAPTDTNGTGGNFWQSSALNVAGVAPSTSSVQALGTTSEYQLARKLYFNSLYGFGRVNAEGAGGTTGDATAADEITLAKYEATATNIVPILNTYSYFGLGTQTPQGGTDTPFCEDFNALKLCGGSGTESNGCADNNGVTGIPGESGGFTAIGTANGGTNPVQSTVCGDGVVGPYEECDWKGNVKGGAGGCSSSCRCVLDYNAGTGACN
jgi:hypothetical protein